VKRTILAALALALASAPLLHAQDDPAGRFRAANEAARGEDYPAAIAAYRQLAIEGHEAGSLYWNWGQAALARGSHGEALWALLRGRELEPGDHRLAAEIERVREAASLDPAEIAPEPLAGLARSARRWHLDALALALLGASVGLHLLARRRGGWAVGAAWGCGVLALVVALPPLAALASRPTAVIVDAEAPLLDAATPTAAVLGTLREGEVVPVLARSAGYLRLEDSSGARGWARVDDVWLLAAPPPG
jgi:hypothetical protein